MPYTITIEQEHRAVATLDEAWDKLPPGIADTTLARERFALEESGHCTFEIANGDTIYIELMTNAFGRPVSAGDYLRGRGWTLPRAMSEAEIIDAYNAEQKS